MHTIPIVGASIQAPTIYDCFYYSQKQFENLQKRTNKRAKVQAAPLGAGNVTYIDGDSLAADLYRYAPTGKGKERTKWRPLTGGDFETQVHNATKGGYITFDQKNFYNIQTYLVADDRLRVVLKRV